MNDEASSSPVAFANRILGYSFGLISRAVAGPSRISGAHHRSPDTPSTAPDFARVQSALANNPPPVPPKAPPAYDDLDTDMSSTNSDDHWFLTTLVARELQNEFDSEDRQIRQEHAELAARYMQFTFQCSICMDELPEDDVATVDDCVHMMCRSCLKEFVSSKIQEHRYPIFCPVCTSVKDRNARPGGVDAQPLWIVKTTRRRPISCVLRVTVTTYGAKVASRRLSSTVRTIRATERLSWTI
ncbi:hypothetical protein J3R82DRAFT_1183 [Butyriboletus roseoflavus]|nr:hypothetical protein J3R82DRAFT_1183 [Butyriboletus roseoflavus]